MSSFLPPFSIFLFTGLFLTTHKLFCSYETSTLSISADKPFYLSTQKQSESQIKPSLNLLFQSILLQKLFISKSFSSTYTPKYLKYLQTFLFFQEIGVIMLLFQSATHKTPEYTIWLKIYILASHFALYTFTLGTKNFAQCSMCVHHSVTGYEQ